VFVCVCVI